VDTALVTTLFPYFAVGVVFGGVMLEAEVISWFRIQEMFRFEAFHMYGIIASAILVAGISLEIIRRLRLRGSDGQPIGPAPKAVGRGARYVIGGTLFGIGWALTGACPGPLVALVGGGVSVMLVAIASALLGTWTYGYLRPRLPH
jgi:uncharacterized membrane protein YedE/YeeE